MSAYAPIWDQTLMGAGRVCNNPRLDFVEFIFLYQRPTIPSASQVFA